VATVALGGADIVHERAEEVRRLMALEIGKPVSADARLGDPLEEDTLVGPVIDEEARQRIARAIDAVVRKGAREIAGGRGEGGHLRPTVLVDVPLDSEAWAREIFGPVIAVAPFDSFDEAVTLANGTDYGLQAGIFTRDLSRAIAAANRLEFGGVTVNETPSFRVDQMPYGGVKESGNTREGPQQAVLEMTEERMVAVRTGP
jgi:acyl-CoA reductase-like NAD-dependent aldehyde dehydrogenase